MHYINTETLDYPVYRARLVRDNPNTSFPKDKPLGLSGYAPVYPTAKPEGDVVAEGQPEMIDGTYYQTWVVRPFTAEELEAYKQKMIGVVVDRQYREADKGIVVGDLPVATTINSIAEITGAVQGTGRNPARVRKINLRGGRAEMDQSQLTALADAVDAFRQACHDRGYDICAQIEAATDSAAVKAIFDAEINTGWPV